MTRKKIAWFALGCMGMALAVAVLYTMLAAAQTTHAIRETQVDNHQVLATIQDCTQPAGDCYKRGQAQTAGAVAAINRVVILASACSASIPAGTPVPERTRRISACVRQALR